MSQLQKFVQQPSLAEMLADPVIQSVMRRDGVEAPDIQRLISTMKEKLRVIQGNVEREAA